MQLELHVEVLGPGFFVLGPGLFVLGPGFFVSGPGLYVTIRIHMKLHALPKS